MCLSKQAVWRGEAGTVGKSHWARRWDCEHTGPSLHPRLWAFPTPLRDPFHLSWHLRGQVADMPSGGDQTPLGLRLRSALDSSRTHGQQCRLQRPKKSARPAWGHEGSAPGQGQGPERTQGGCRTGVIIPVTGHLVWPGPRLCCDSLLMKK